MVLATSFLHRECTLPGFKPSLLGRNGWMQVECIDGGSDPPDDIFWWEICFLCERLAINEIRADSVAVRAAALGSVRGRSGAGQTVQALEP
eukprot:2858008-Prymnesium_polylepis.1